MADGADDPFAGLGGDAGDPFAALGPRRTTGERFGQNTEDALARGPAMAIARAEGDILAANPSAASGFSPEAMGGIKSSDLKSKPVEGLSRIFTVGGERKRREGYEAQSKADPF